MALIGYDQAHFYLEINNLKKMPLAAFEFYIGNFCSMYKVFLTIQNGLIASKFKTQLSALKKSLN